jgi:hypothetical protein
MEQAMAIVSESLKAGLDGVRKGLAGLEKSVAVLEKRFLRSLESGRTWLKQVRSELPGQLKRSLEKLSKSLPRSFATQADLRAVIAKVEEFEARLGGSFRDAPASKKPRPGAKA